MTALAPTFSADQAAAWDAIAEALRGAGINLDDSLLMPPEAGGSQVMAVIFSFSIVTPPVSFRRWPRSTVTRASLTQAS